LYAALEDHNAKVRAAAVTSLASLFPEYGSTDEIPAEHEQVLEKLMALSRDTDHEVVKQASLAYAKFLQPEDGARHRIAEECRPGCAHGRRWGDSAFWIP